MINEENVKQSALKEQKKFLRAHFASALIFCFTAFSLEKCGFPVLSSAVLSGAAFSLLSVIFFSELIKTFLAVKGAGLNTTLLALTKILLLILFFKNLELFSLGWILSAAGGLLSIGPAALWYGLVSWGGGTNVEAAGEPPV